MDESIKAILANLGYFIFGFFLGRASIIRKIIRKMKRLRINIYGLEDKKLVVRIKENGLWSFILEKEQNEDNGD